MARWVAARALACCAAVWLCEALPAIAVEPTAPRAAVKSGAKLKWVSPSQRRTGSTAVAASVPAATEQADAPSAVDTDRVADRTAAEKTPHAVSPVRRVVAHGSLKKRGTAKLVVRADAEVTSDPFQNPFGDEPGSQRRPAVERTVARIVAEEDGPPGVPRLQPAQAEGEELMPPGAEEMPDFAGEGAEDSAVPDRNTLEEELAAAPGSGFGPCPSPSEELKKIGEITDNIVPEGTEFPQECTLGDEPFMSRQWGCVTYHWKASGVCHKPLYFQQVAVERYGHTWPLIQPLVSAANFFGTFPVLPYKMGLSMPNECIYPLGYYRPGSCAPYMINAVPISVRAGLMQAGAWVGGVYLIP